MHKIALFFLVSVLFAGCASGGAREMSAKDEARYAAAIEREPESAVPSDVEFTVTYARDPEPASAVAPSGPARDFRVTRADYDAFFAQGPASVLTRMTVEAIVDGGKLLGYRIDRIASFDGVDLRIDDIILAIDGKLPRDPDEYFERWEHARTSDGCRVTVQRDVTRFDLTWHVE